MHRHRHHHPYTPYLPYSPVSFDINVSPVVEITTVTQTANAISLGGFAVASNVASINQ